MPRKEQVKWQGLTPNPSKFFGFCYLITNLITKRQYIGKKQYYKLNPRRSRKKPIADLSGKWQAQHWVESDWRTYTSSCDALNDDIQEHGMDNFEFKIISQHACLGDLTYAEVEHLVKKDALILRDDEGDRVFYNGNIMAIKFIPPNKESETLNDE